jgi:hypothetical protein
MNERIKELAELAGFNLGRFDVGSASLLSQRIERFAELVRQDEREQAEYDKLTVKFGERAKEYLVEAKKSWQEPVAYKYTDKTNPLVFYFTTHKDSLPNPDVIETELYTAPPKREIDMSTKPENIDTSEERVHETDKSVHEEIERLKTEIKRLKDLAEYRLQLLMKMPENKPVMRMLRKGEEPPKREWVGLTEKEIDAIGYKYGAGGLDLMDELSAMLKERNA